MLELFLILGMSLSFSPLILMLACCELPLLCLDISIICQISPQILPWRNAGFCQRTFMHLKKKRSKSGFFFSLLIWWVTFNDFHIWIHLGWSHLDHGKSFSDVFFTLLIWFIWIFSLLLVNCNKGLSILLIFLKNKLFVSLNFYMTYLFIIFYTYISPESDYFWNIYFLDCFLFFLLQFPGVLLNY